MNYDSILEGVCPIHRQRLDPRDPRPPSEPYGWCDPCQGGWARAGEHVIFTQESPVWTRTIWNPRAITMEWKFTDSTSPRFPFTKGGTDEAST